MRGWELAVSGWFHSDRCSITEPFIHGPVKESLMRNLVGSLLSSSHWGKLWVRSRPQEHRWRIVCMTPLNKKQIPSFHILQVRIHFFMLHLTPVWSFLITCIQNKSLEYMSFIDGPHNLHWEVGDPVEKFSVYVFLISYVSALW